MFITYFLPLFCLPALVDSPSMLCTSVRIIYQKTSRTVGIHIQADIIIKYANIKIRDWNELAGASNIANIKFRAWVRIIDMIPTIHFTTSIASLERGDPWLPKIPPWIRH